MSLDHRPRAFSRRAFVLLVLGQLLLALVFTAPVVLRLGQMELWGGNPDTFQSLWNFWWVKTGLTGAGERVFFTDWIFHPGGMPLALHTFCPLKSLLALPLGLFLGAVDCQNLLMLATFWAAGVSAFLLVYDWCGRVGAALLGALVFAYSPYHSVHALGHLNLASIEFLPLYFLCLGRVFGGVPGHLGHAHAGNRRGWALGLGIAWALTFWVDFQYALFLLLFTPLFWLGLRGFARSSTRDDAPETPDLEVPWNTRLSATLPWAVLSAALLAAPLALGIARELLRTGLPTPGGSSPQFSLDLVSVAVPSPLGHASAQLLGPFLARFPGWFDSYEHIGYVGLLPLVLALLALRGDARFRVWRWFLVVGWILSLGPSLQVLGRDTGIPLPSALFRFVVGLDQFRAPGRFQVMTSLALALLVPEAWSRLSRSLAAVPRRAAGAVLYAFVALDLVAVPEFLAPVSIPPVVDYLAAQPDHEAVYLLALDEAEYVWMYRQTLCEKKLLIGHAARLYPAYEQRAEDLSQHLLSALLPDLEGHFEEAEAVRREFRAADVGYVVAPLSLVGATRKLRGRYEAMTAHFFPAGPVYHDDQYALFRLGPEN